MSVDFLTKIQNLYLMDKSLTEKFYEIHNANEKIQNLNSRIEKNNQILKEQYDFFISTAEDETYLQKIFDHFDLFINKLENKKITRKEELISQFLHIKHINQITNQTFDLALEKDFVYKKFCLIIYNSLKQIELECIETLWSDDFNNNNFSTPIDSFYSRNLVVASIENKFETWLFFLSYVYQIKIETNGFKHFTALFLLFLESKKYIMFESKKKFENSSVNFQIRYKFKKTQKFLDQVNFDFIYLNFSLFEPLLVVNEHLITLNIKKGMCFQLPDFIFKAQLITRTNLNYGSINNNDTSKKHTISQNFLNPKSKLLFDIIKKDNKTCAYIDKENFFPVISKFIQDNFKNLSITWDTSVEEIIKQFKIHSNVNSTKNKILLNNFLILLYLKIFYQKYWESGKFYFNFFYDFRGRKYYDSMISITNFKPLRFIITYGTYSKKELNFIIKESLKTKAFKIIQRHIPLVLNSQAPIASFYYDKNKSIKEQKYFQGLLVNYVILIGVIFKSEILTFSNQKKDNFLINIEEFIQKGLDKLILYERDKINFFNNLNFEDEFKLKKLFEKIFYQPDIYLKDMMGLDFSCSGHQLRNLFQGFENEENYKFINLKGEDTYCDMYTLIITKFKSHLTSQLKADMKTLKLNKTSIFKKILEVKSLLKSDGEILNMCNFLNRKLLKKSIMTVEYNAKSLTFLKYFTSSFTKESEHLFYRKYRSSIDILLTLLFDFTKHLNFFDDFKSAKPLNFIMDEVTNNNYLLTLFDGFEVNLAAFSKIQKNNRIVLYDDNMIRYTMTLNEYSSMLDEMKTKNSIMPNFIHALDGAIVRNCIYTKKTSGTYFSIHDEFWIPLQEIFLFKDQINKILKTSMIYKKNQCAADEEFFKDYYNFFVIL